MLNARNFLTRGENLWGDSPKVVVTKTYSLTTECSNCNKKLPLYWYLSLYDCLISVCVLALGLSSHKRVFLLAKTAQINTATNIHNSLGTAGQPLWH